MIRCSRGRQSNTRKSPLHIFLAFRFQIAQPVVVVLADHFDGQVRSLGLTVGVGNPPWPEIDEVRVPELARPQTNRKGSKEHLTGADAKHAGLQHPEQKPNDPLMERTRHGQYLDIAIGQFHKPIGPLLQREYSASVQCPCAGNSSATPHDGSPI